MHFLRNLIQFLMQSAVSFGKQYDKAYKISHFCVTFNAFLKKLNTVFNAVSCQLWETILQSI